MFIRCFIAFLWLTAGLPFGAAAESPVAADPLRAGDVLRIDLPGEEGFNIEFPVDQEGRIRLPEVGYLKVRGYGLDEARRRIETALSEVLRDLSELRVSRVAAPPPPAAAGPSAVPETAGPSPPRLPPESSPGSPSGSPSEPLAASRPAPPTVPVAGPEPAADPGGSAAVPGLAESPADPDSPPLTFGDVLRIDLPGEETLNAEFTIDRQGRIRLPEVGYLKVEGYPLAEAERRIRLALAQVLRDLSRLSVTREEPTVLVKVMGFVNKPGQVTLPADGGIQSALEAAGGLRAGAQLDRMQVRRDGKVISFDFKRYLDTGDPEVLPRLRSLDEIFVPASPFVGNVQGAFSDTKLADGGDAADENAGVKVFGEVRGPGMFAYKPGMSVVDALMRAQGVTQAAAVDQIRLLSEGEPQKFNLTAYLDRGDKSLLPELKPGATIFVPRQQEEIKVGRNTVYVMGEVNRNGAFENSDNATFMDILANAGGPTRYAETRNITLLRADGGVERFDLHAYTEGISRTPPPKMRSGDAIFVPEKTDMNEKSWIKVAPSRAVRVIGEVVRPGRYEWSDEMNLLDILSHVGGPTMKGDTAHLRIMNTDAAGRNQVRIFDLEDFLLKGGDARDLPRITAGTTIVMPALPDDPSDNKAQWLRLPANESIYVLGQVNAPGRYAFNDSMGFLDILAAVNGPGANADLFNVRVNHRNGKRVQVTTVNLARYFETGDDTLLPQLRPGDTIFFPDRNQDWRLERKEETIRVLGAVAKPGRYRFDDTLTLLDLLAQAGGTTASAWIERITVVNLSCCKDQARVFNMDRFMRKADFTALPVVRAGDTVFVPDKTQSTGYEIRQGITDIVRIVSLYNLIDNLAQGQ